MLALLSADSYRSDICRAEQLRSLRAGKCVIPLLVRADAPRCRLLFTTRDARIAAALGAHEHPVELLTHEQSMALLAKWSQQALETLPPEAAEVVRECGHLPLAVAMIGAMVRGKPHYWLVDLSLARRDEAGRLTLHDLQLDYARRQVGEAGLPALHGRLLEAYAAWRLNGWPTGPDDGYFFQHLAWHLAQAGRLEELRGLLLDFDWLEARLNATDANALLTDYDWLPGDPELRLLQGAVRLSAHILAHDRSQLAGQLLGRLLAVQSPEIQATLGKARGWRGAPWLQPLAAGLTPPGGALLRTLAGHTAPVWGVAVSADFKRAVSASTDRTLKVWDVASGAEVHTLRGHTASVRGVAVSADGKWAISASEDCTLKVWDLASGAEVHTLRGHTDRVMGVAVSADGKRAISASTDRTLKVWDLASGAEIASFSADAPLCCCAATPDGSIIVAGDAAGGVHFFRLEGA